MNTTEATTLAKSLMKKHGLSDWQFRFSKGIMQLGCCHYKTKTISLSRRFVELNDETAVLDTILHEIAHALTPGVKHGLAWKLKCLELGCRPVAYASAATVKIAPPSWETVCTKCKKVTRRTHRKRPASSMTNRISICCRAPVTQVVAVSNARPGVVTRPGG